jgi:hypothetical protein
MFQNRYIALRFWVLAMTISGGARGASADAEAFDAVVSLPEFVVEGTHKVSALYGELPGIQIFSLCSEKETQAFARELQAERFLLSQLFPERARAPFTVPLLFILKPATRARSTGTRFFSATATGPRGDGRGDFNRFLASDADAFALSCSPKTSEPGLGLAGEVMPWRYPTAPFLANMAPTVPYWAQAYFAHDFFLSSVVNSRLYVVSNAIAARLPFPPLDRLFVRDRQIDPAGRDHTLADGLLADVARAGNINALNVFTQWALLEDRTRANAFWPFAERAFTEPVTEEMFRRYFGVTYAEMQNERRRTGAQEISTGTQFRPAGIKLSAPKFPEIALHAATPTEVLRVRNEWKRLVARQPANGTRQVTPEMRSRALREVVRELQAAVERGERDPQVRAELALALCDEGLDDEAQPQLEAALAAGAVRPRLNYELARLRFRAARAAPAGADGKLSAAQADAIAAPLQANRSLVPALADVYLLLADTLARAERAPSPDELAMLREGVRRFPRHTDLARRAMEIEQREDGAVATLGGADLFEHEAQARAAAFKEMERRMAVPYRPLSKQLAPEVSAEPSAPQSQFVFELLPKSLQFHPRLDMTILTSFTTYGRDVTPATPEQPAYYVLQSAGYRELGVGVGGTHAPPATRMESLLKDALAANGYLPARDGRRPSLAIILTWGVHNAPHDGDIINPLERRLGFQERYRLIVGKGPPPSGMRKWQTVNDQRADDLYFIVASAYDYDQLAHGARKLVWRTHMTVGAGGISMTESFGPLLATAAPYFGREMHEVEVASRRISRVGNVEIGPLRVVPEGAPPAGEPAKTPAAPEKN